ncbi:MAG: hypothetical protein GQ574_23060 [Crocinitomix sp.]|nr:hypothetical protein [Crocinitomix sp.]
MSEKLAPIRVKLLKWEITDAQTVNLYFEKVASYTSERDFTKPDFPVTVWTDFGYLDLTLRVNNIENEKEYDGLNKFIGDDQIFLEEEFENDITFWEGEDEDRYDWSSGYSIRFYSKHIEHVQLSVEAWKRKYVEMTLRWEQIANERQDILQRDFLKLFILIEEGNLSSFMPNAPSDELKTYKNSVSASLNSWLKSFEDRIEEIEKVNATPEKEKVKDTVIQEKINTELDGFWQKLANKFKKNPN